MAEDHHRLRRAREGLRRHAAAPGPDRGLAPDLDQAQDPGQDQDRDPDLDQGLADRVREEDLVDQDRVDRVQRLDPLAVADQARVDLEAMAAQGRANSHSFCLSGLPDRLWGLPFAGPFLLPANSVAKALPRDTAAKPQAALQGHKGGGDPDKTLCRTLKVCPEKVEKDF